MGTRSQAFTAKIRNLQELQYRLLQGSVPLPQGHEVANSLKYFSTTLLSVLRDVPGQPLLMMKSAEFDLDRLALFPSLDYKGLFNTLLQFLDMVPLIPSGLFDFGKAFFCTLCSLIPFLEREDIDSLPYVVAATLLTLPVSLHEDVLDVLCWHLLPFTMNSNERTSTVDNCVLPDSSDGITSASGVSLRKVNYASNSASAILMMVFQFVKDNSAIHRKITECLADHKDDLTKDLLCVIAHGTPSARAPASNLLFYYWPNLNPTLYDRRNMLNRLNSSETWKPPKCFHPDCTGLDAVKMCFDHTVSLAHHPDRAPPSFYCGECYEKLKRQSPNSANLYEDINHPIEQSDTTCENKNCRSQGDKTAVALCFSRECTSYNGNRPVRLCNTCNNIRHNTRRGADHVVHNSLPSPWDMDPETQNYLVKAVVALLQEAVPYGSGRNRSQAETQRRTMQVLTNADEEEEGWEDEATLNERRLLSRYGVWLLVGLSTPKPNPDETPSPTFGHMLSMLFQWFNATAYLPSDKTGTALEKLKSENLPQWLRKVYKSHPDVFVQCVLPNPPDYAKVGGHWEILASRTDHIKEGLVRFFCLIPYDVITLQVWNQAMSHWMEAINQDVPREELTELKSVFCKIFDPDMSPLGFDARQMYQFISERFVHTSADVQKQALLWLQKLCLLEILIPLDVLFDMLNTGLDALVAEDDPENRSEIKPIVEMRSVGCISDDDTWMMLSSYANQSGLVPEEEDSMEFTPAPTTKEETLLTCYNLMIDVMNGQMELQDIDKHSGLKGQYANDILGLIKKMLTASWLSDIHKCLNDAADLELDEHAEAGVTLVEELLTDFLQMTNATIRKVAPQENDADDDEGQNTTHSGSDGGGAPAAGTDAKILKKPGLGGFMAVLATMQSTVEKTRDIEETTSESSLDGTDEEFVVKIEEYPIPLQLVYFLLVRNAEANDPDMRYYLLDSVRLLALQCDVLSGVARKHRKFLHCCQESLLTGVLWKVLESSQSQVAQVAVPLLLHAVTLPGGADVLWKSIDDDFQHEDWRVRFSAVEKVTTLFRFLEDKPVRKSAALRSVLSHSFCCIIAILEDINPVVSLRANLHLGTIHDNAIKTLVWCLEYQFDSVPIDRPVILKRFYQLFNCLIDRKFLSWKFFASRFETIVNEIHATRITDFSSGPVKHDQIRMSASNNAAAIAAANNPKRNLRSGDSTAIRSLSASLKFPYKRTISAPAGMGLSSRSSGGQYPAPASSSGTGTPCNRQTSAQNLKGRNARDTLSKQASNVGATFEDFDYVAVNVAARSVDLDEVDKETIHLLVFLFMQFLSQPDQAIIPDEKPQQQQQKNQPWQRAFQLLHALLGYNENERRFTTMPHKIRSAPAVNSYLANLPQVLDTNFEIGKTMLLNCILILQKTPFPPRYATNWQQTYTLMQEKYLFQGCGFSLWHLEPTMRKNWLSAVLVIMYKYNFSPDTAMGERVVGLVRIVIHTIAAHSHVCDRFAKPMTGFSVRSRDLSQLSLGGDAENQHTEAASIDEPNFHNLEEQDDNVEEEEEEEEEEEVEEPAEEVKTDEAKKYESENVEKGVATVEMTNLFGLLPRPSSASAASKPPPTPMDFEMTSEGLPAGWAMQLMRSGRTLFIDNRNQVTTWIDPRTGRPSDPVRPDPTSLSHFMFESPPSPQSLMDVITVGSPVAVDISESSASSATSPKFGMFDPPQEERLLPIGVSRTNSVQKSGTGAQGRILDRVWQVFGGLEPETIPLIEEKLTCERVQVVASIHKQDSSDCTKEDEGKDSVTTECYIGHVTHFRNDSFRKAKNPENDLEDSRQAGQITIVTTAITAAVSTVEEKKEPTKQQQHHPPQLQTQISVNARADTKASKSKSTKIEASKLRRRKLGTGTGPDLPGIEATSATKTGAKAKPSRQQSSNNQSRMDSSGSLFSTRDNPLLLRQSCLRIGEDSIMDRCSKCGLTREEYSEDEIGNCIVILSTFVNREPGLAAPLLPEILLVVSRIARDSQYSWELDSNTYIPSNSRSIAKQFIRCVLHQLSGNGIFWMIFHLKLEEDHRLKFFTTIASCLMDFTELTPAAPVATFMQELDEKKSLHADQLAVALPNLACYLSCLQYEQVTVIWTPVFPACDSFFRRLWNLTGNSSIKTGSEKENSGTKVRSEGGSGEGSIQLGSQMGPLFDIMCCILRMAGVATHRSLLDAMGKLVSHGLQNCSCLTYQQVASVCHLSNRAFSKDRDRLLVTRSAVFDLVQALKFKISLPDANFLLLTSLVLQDAGGSFQDDIAALGLGGSDPNGFSSYNPSDANAILNTGACEVMRNHMQDILEFLADVHTLSKVKSNVKGLTVGLNEDTLGGILKASLAQYVALEITRGNGKDNKSANRFLPWLFNPPANTAAQGPREFLECVAHIRLLSWLLLGSVNHTIRHGVSESAVSQPIPLEASCHIADQVQVILAGFAEQSKTSVVHMCSLFHAFILCQLWTVYLEQTVATSTPKDDGQLLAGSILLDFWGKVTPGILQLVSHSKVLAEMVNLHFLSLMEALTECNSTILVKLMPLWTPVLFAYRTQLPDHVRVRLQAVQDYKPPEAHHEDQLATNTVLGKWLQHLQFKMGQIEMQASNVTQFFTV